MDINQHREQIDSLNIQIIELLNQRAKHALKIGEIKKQNNLPIYVPEREKAILEKVKSLNQGPMLNSDLQHIFKQIMAFTQKLEQNIQVSFLGPQGSYTHEAGVHFFGSAFDEISCVSIKDVFLEVDKKRATFGVVPIENSYYGSVFQTLDCLIDFDLKIIGEIVLRIRHQLLSKTSSLEEIKTIYAHGQSFEQCREYLSSHLPLAEKIEVSSNSKAAQMALQTPYTAAIAGSLASEIYNLPIIAKDIEDALDNSTRFVVLGKEFAENTPKTRTSLIFSIADKPGLLQKILKAFANKNINLTRIESRPSRRKAWDYIFFIDFEGHFKDSKVQVVLKELTELALFIKILGSYPLAGNF